VLPGRDEPPQRGGHVGHAGHAAEIAQNRSNLPFIPRTLIIRNLTYTIPINGEPSPAA
jgi:hypothetical protein